VLLASTSQKEVGEVGVIFVLSLIKRFLFSGTLKMVRQIWVSKMVANSRIKYEKMYAFVLIDYLPVLTLCNGEEIKKRTLQLNHQAQVAQ
jgi:hypothetical protein